MQREALALGYFFLAAFCGYPLAMVSAVICWVYVIAALIALVTAMIYLNVLPPFGKLLPAFGKWLSDMFRIAQEPPKH